MPTNIYRLGEAEPLSGRVKCECAWCGRVFASGGAGFCEEPNTVRSSALWKCSGKSAGSFGVCTLCGWSGRRAGAGSHKERRGFLKNSIFYLKP